MVNTVALRVVDAPRSIVCATHDRVDAADSGCWMLERHFQGRCEAREEAREAEVEELASFGLAYLARVPKNEC